MLVHLSSGLNERIKLQATPTVDIKSLERQHERISGSFRNVCVVSSEKHGVLICFLEYIICTS
jgi:hypothetical protein